MLSALPPVPLALYGSDAGYFRPAPMLLYQPEGPADGFCGVQCRDGAMDHLIQTTPCVAQRVSPLGLCSRNAGQRKYRYKRWAGARAGLQPADGLSSLRRNCPDEE